MTIVHEKSRTEIVEEHEGKRKRYIPDRFAVFVNLSDGKEYVAVLEFDSEINPKYLVDEKTDDYFNTMVTVFEPDVEKGGEEYDYLEYLTSHHYNEEIDIIKEPAETDAAIGQPLTTASATESSNNSIHQTASKINHSEQKLLKKIPSRQNSPSPPSKPKANLKSSTRGKRFPNLWMQKQMTTSIRWSRYLSQMSKGMGRSTIILNILRLITTMRRLI